jgi:CheY-like chemotaxis protein
MMRVLSQGTGIGLFLCKTLTELMGGEIYLDPSYHSGVPDHPGTRFVVDLKQPPLEGALAMDPDVLKMLNASSSSNSKKHDESSASNSQLTSYELPEKLNILFVDDDPILRKLFTRTIKSTYPNYVVREAANGETALRLCEEGEQYDLIFVDMYMASVEKQLLGTETVSELRHRGIKSRMCGLSANDKEEEFLDAGADCFMFKPFPCKKDEIADALCHVLFDDQRNGTQGMTIFDS